MLRRNAQATIIGDSDAPTETGLVAEKIGLVLAKHGIISLILPLLAYPLSYRQAHNLNRIEVIQAFLR